MPHRYLIGLDIGTSGAKCILADETGRVVASSTREYPLHTPRPGWAEQDPADWWRAVCEGAADIIFRAGVDAAEIAGLSLSGQMHGLVALDAQNQVIRPSILWCDQRTQPQCDWVTERAGGLGGLLRLTNNRMLTGYTGGKILWLRDEEPDNFARMAKFTCPKDYIRLLLTDELAIDVSDASGTGFFNTRERAWSDELIALAGLDKSIFPPVLESTALAGRVTRRAAQATGLPEGLKVYAGGGDAVIQTTGAGLIKPGVLGVVIGTAGNVSMGLSGYADNPGGNLQMFCNNEPHLWHAFGCTLTAGGAYRWYRDALCEHDLAEAGRTGKNVYSLMDAAAARSTPGANGAIFLPYLTGERCPYPDPNARGAFYGLSLSTDRADITRAVMEGVTYSLKQVIDLIGQFEKSEKVYASGGGAASPLWRQMQADIFDLPVYTMSAASEGGAYGAVMVAGVGAGVWKNLDEAISILQVETETLPNPRNQPAYREAFEVYSRLYGALKPVFDFAAR
ncbi:MAG: xylulokinase [Clostridiales bacterium]|nr:xylulokinase [Clostridiales bacterium]